MRGERSETRMARVPRREAEKFRRRLNSRGGIRKDLRIIDDGDWVLIPLDEAVEDEEVRELGGEPVQGETSVRQSFRSPMDMILAEVEERLVPLVPRKWEKVGDILILRFPQELKDRREEIGRIYANVLGAKTVCDDVGGIRGEFRRPCLELIIGDETETVHTENGILYALDVSKVMFSSGNIDERSRMGDLDCTGETVVDMFAGIGYFTLPVAVHGGAEKVIACEKNPDAQEYLSKNMALNHVENVVEIFRGDNRDLPGSGFADRVIMGYVGTESFLWKGFDLVRSGGTVHYHDTCPIDMLDRAERGILHAAGERNVEIIDMREVKSYAPAISHYVWDLRVL